MGGCTDHFKSHNKWIQGSTAGSNNNTVKGIKIPLLPKKYFSSPPSINLKIDSGETHNFHEIGTTNLPQKPTSEYNPPSRVIVPNGESMVSSTTTHLPIPSLPPYSTKSNGFNHLTSISLFSVGQSCNHNFTAIFDKKL